VCSAAVTGCLYARRHTSNVHRTIRTVTSRNGCTRGRHIIIIIIITVVSYTHFIIIPKEYYSWRVSSQVQDCRAKAKNEERDAIVLYARLYNNNIIYDGWRCTRVLCVISSKPYIRREVSSCSYDHNTIIIGHR